MSGLRVRILLNVVFLSVLSLMGCSGNALGPDFVARVNGEVITKQAFESAYQKTLTVMNVQPESPVYTEENPLSKMFQKITLQNLILNSLVEQEAQKRHLAVSDKELQAAYDLQVLRSGGEDKLTQQLEKIHLTNNDFMAELKNQLLKDKVVMVISKDKIHVSEQEAKAYFKDHAQQFNQPEQVRARHILIAANAQQIQADLLKVNPKQEATSLAARVDTLLADKRKKADEVFGMVKAQPENFESLAQKYSDDKGSAQAGGDLGYFAKEMMVPPFSKAAFETKPGEIHPELVQSQFGFHIIQVVDRKAPEKKTFSQVKDQIVLMLESQRKSKAMDSWLEDQKKIAKIEIAPQYDFEKQLKTDETPHADKKL